MTREFNETLLLALKICEGQYVENQASKKGFSAMYPFTTENIAGYIDLFNLKDKSLLTVGSSLDQVLNAMVYDCKDITVLDINPHTKYYYYLKIAALLELSRPEFLEYLRYKDYPEVFEDNRNVFNKETFNKIKGTIRLLDYESYLYWDELFQIYEPRKVRIRLFKLDEYRTSMIIDSNPYLQSEESYSLLKNKVKKTEPKFIIDDIFETELTKKYDNIWLSNICYYLEKENIEKIIDLVNMTTKSLTAEGKLLISYLYDTKKDTEYQDNWRPIYNLDMVYELLKDYQLSQEEFLGVNGLKFKDERFHDSVLIYQKK